MQALTLHLGHQAALSLEMQTTSDSIKDRDIVIGDINVRYHK